MHNLFFFKFGKMFETLLISNHYETENPFQEYHKKIQFLFSVFQTNILIRNNQRIAAIF